VFAGKEEHGNAGRTFQFLSHIRRRLKKVTYTLELYEFAIVFGENEGKGCRQRLHFQKKKNTLYFIIQIFLTIRVKL